MLPFPFQMQFRHIDFNVATVHVVPMKWNSEEHFTSSLKFVILVYTWSDEIPNSPRTCASKKDKGKVEMSEFQNVLW